MTKKKLSSLLLAFAMLLSLLPMGALAEEEPVTTWGELVDAMEKGGNVVLGATLKAPSTDQVLKVPKDKMVTLDLNGFTIDGSALKHTDVVIVNGKLTLKDSNGGGMITGNGQDVADVQNDGSFTVEGGKIENTNSSGFGAVYVRVSGTFTVSGAPVIEGGVYLSSDTSGNHSSITIGGPLAKETLIYVKMYIPGVFTKGLSGNGTTENFASLDEDYTVILADNGEAKLAKVDPGPAVLPDPDPDWAELQVALSQNGTVKLEQNYTATSGNTPLVIHANNKVTLDLNGYTIDGSALAHSALAPYDVLRVYGRLTLTDSSESGNGKIIANGEDNKIGYVIKIIEKSGKKGQFTMTGGAITANGCKGAVYVQKDNQFTMTGGAITANKCDDAVDVKEGQFTMTGGAITASDCYDAVYVDGGQFTMTGGTITAGNYKYDAVFVDEGSTFSLSGAPVINGGVYLYEGIVITIGGELTITDPIGVSVVKSNGTPLEYVKVPGVFTSGWSTYMSGKDPADYFTSGDSSYAVALTSGGEARLASPVTLSATPDVGNVSISPSGRLYAGDAVTLTAQAVPGWTFLGWFSGHWDDQTWVDNDSGNPVCSTLVYTFTITENTVLLAKYEPRGNATVTVQTENGAQYTVGTDTTVKTGSTETVQLGTTLALAAVDKSKVLQWQNESGKVLGTGGTLAIPVTGNMTITLVYKNEEEGRSFVQFVSDYGQVLAAHTYQKTDSINFPTEPSKLGYTFDKWVFDRTENEATEATIKAKIGTDKVIIVKPSYSQINTKCTVTVTYSGVNRENAVYSDISLGTGYTVTAPDIEGYKFECWKNAAGTILGYKSSYFFLVAGDVALTACYVSEDEPAEEAQPVIALGQPYRTESGGIHKVSCAATRSVPEGYSLIEQGMLYAVGFVSPNTDNFQIGEVGVTQYMGTSKNPNGVLYMNIRVANDNDNVTFRGYMIVENTNTGNMETYYSGITTASYSECA